MFPLPTSFSELGSRWRARSGPLTLLVCLVSSGCAEAAGTNYAGAIRLLQNVARTEVQDGNLSGVSIAVVDDQEIVFAGGFGFADKKRRVPAARDTVYRAGSISKLFTALAAMQLAEQGKLNIDEAVTKYNPEFRILQPFENAAVITLRQLMCHRAGLIRESPVGGYFDDREPSMTESVASIANCMLVYPPNTRTKYSNIGVTVVGQTVEKVSRKSFNAYQQDQLLGPIGMTNSAFLINRKLKAQLAAGYMLVPDRDGRFREIEAPQFEFGIIAAGNLYTTAEDLARFAKALLAGGRAGSRQVIKQTTLVEMFTPQLTKETNGFGLGFHAGRFRQHRAISHTGAVYGFSSSLMVLPDLKVGVIVLANDDIAMGPVEKVNKAALSFMLEAKMGEKPPPAPEPISLSEEALSEFTGEFESQSYWAELRVKNGKLEANVSAQSFTLTPVEPRKFVGSGRYADEASFVWDSAKGATGFTALGQQFKRVPAKPVTPIPEQWKKLLGRYGPAFIPLIVSVRHGHLYALTENMFDYRLTPMNTMVFKMSPGLYTDEHLVFQAGPTGDVHTAILANMPLRRLNVPGSSRSPAGK